jgi:hypothetical protein
VAHVEKEVIVSNTAAVARPCDVVARRGSGVNEFGNRDVPTRRRIPKRHAALIGLNLENAKRRRTKKMNGQNTNSKHVDFIEFLPLRGFQLFVETKQHV